MSESRVFTFFPLQLPLPIKTEYQLVLDDVELCADGGLATPDTTFFKTERYGVISVSPENGGNVPSYSSSIILTFNVAVDSLSVFENFVVSEASQGPVQGKYYWQTDLRKFTFVVDQQYRRIGVYKVFLDGQTQDIEARPLGEDFTSYFRTSN